MVAISSYLALSCLAGLVMYAYYAGCAPLRTGKIKSYDQVGCTEGLSPLLALCMLKQ
jgi:hypothetical protein